MTDPKTVVARYRKNAGELVTGPWGNSGSEPPPPKSGAPIKMGETWEKGTLRIHRYRDVLKIWDLTNAGKRGKKVELTMVSLTHAYPHDEQAGIDGLVRLLTGYRNYGQAIGALRDLMADYPKSYDASTSQIRGIDVRPSHLKKIRIKTKPNADGDFMEIDSNGLDWSIISTRMHEGPKGNRFAQDTTYSPAGGKRDLRQGALIFHGWLSENESKVARMGIQDLLVILRKLGVKFDSY